MDNKIFEALVRDILNRSPDIESYKEAFKASRSMGKGLSEAIQTYASMGYELDDEFCRTTLKDMLNWQFMASKDLGTQAQGAMNKRMNVFLQVQEPRSGGAIDEIIERALESEFRTSTIMQNVSSFSTKIVSNCANQNAKNMYLAGYKLWIERINDRVGLMGGRDCKYCNEWEGVYYYPNIPDECWGFHQGCSCSMVYHNESKDYVEKIH